MYSIYNSSIKVQKTFLKIFFKTSENVKKTKKEEKTFANVE